jgi:hypothetical protein
MEMNLKDVTVFGSLGEGYKHTFHVPGGSLPISLRIEHKQTKLWLEVHIPIATLKDLIAKAEGYQESTDKGKAQS